MKKIERIRTYMLKNNASYRDAIVAFKLNYTVAGLRYVMKIYCTASKLEMPIKRAGRKIGSFKLNK